ncbi:DUF2341 domain-containing protein [Massilia putida]|uniref:DUF2341 domain-containing protein n=1 Tax=Massilia putida TaxID=1141883 RepID=UPI000951FF1F|nr:DUF2341 domain-containing protein [Massilia putida]
MSAKFKAWALCAAACVLALPAWAGDTWAHKKKLTVDTTATGVEIKEEVAAAPLLVRLHSGNFTFSEARPDGADLRFYAADGKTPLAYHLDGFDAANELANAWVAVPKLAAGAKTDIVVAWGNPDAASAAAPAKTYDGAQLLVWHFGDGRAQDATANGNHGSANGVKPVAAGPIGAALAFDGGARIDVAPSASLKVGAASGMTFSAWVKPGAAGNGTLYAQRDGGKSLVIALNRGALTATGGGARVDGGTLKAGEWHHVAAVAGGGKLTFYVDGVAAGTGAFQVPDLGGSATVGEGFQGELDEVGVAATARSPGFIQAAAASQGPDSPLLSFSDDAAAESGGSVFGILMGAVTLDGWVVIGLLGVMAVVSFYVMISKAVTLRTTTRTNARFLALFKEKSEELLTPGHADTELALDQALARSPIQRLYAIGLRELSKRFEVQVREGRAQNLSAPAIDAIRAAMEAAMLRETQRLNSGLVLLTIAVAGGPFLGLLGTVVGVMITFAAIAAAGDVNVNAIAPGIAAALVATVAGLGVAIPALFGYNWLAAQIKNASNDTTVFVDEFLTRSAEVYS